MLCRWESRCSCHYRHRPVRSLSATGFCRSASGKWARRCSDGAGVTGGRIDGTATPIVLLHGATSSARIWQPLLPELTAHHSVLVPTLAGHLGGPPLSMGRGSVVERIVEDMCAQLDEAGLGSAHLVGNSLGGWVALELARRGRARSVLAFSPAGAWKRAADLQRMLWIFRVGAVLRRSKSLPRVAADPRRRR